jgi:hypothetical protein
MIDGYHDRYSRQSAQKLLIYRVEGGKTHNFRQNPLFALPVKSLKNVTFSKKGIRLNTGLVPLTVYSFSSILGLSAHRLG